MILLSLLLVSSTTASKMTVFVQITSLVLIISSLNCISQSNTVSNAQSEYPQGSLVCKTHDFTELDCSKRYLVDVPVLDENLATKLDLSNNQLTEIKGAPFEQLPLLQSLNLNFNQIFYLSPNAFKGLWFLEKLDLQDNNINSLPMGIFSNLTKLKEIDLFGNWLSTIPNEALEFNSLQQVQMSINGNILDIGKNGLSKMKVLHLFVPLASNINNETFQYLAGLPLQIFHFGFTNALGKAYVVETDAFAPLTNVIFLNTVNEALPALGSLNSPLQSLILGSIQKRFLAINKTTLQVIGKFSSTLLHLTLRDQPLLKKIEDDSFIWTPNLITLNLEHNEINYLAKYAFDGLCVLKTLNLASNDLRAVPLDALEVFRTYATLENLDLSSNYILSHIENDTFFCSFCIFNFYGFDD